MTRRAAQHERVRRTSGFELLAFVLLVFASVVVNAQTVSNTKVPVVASPVAAPPLPMPPSAAMPSAAPSQSPPTTVVPPALPKTPAVQGVEIDRVVAIVNGELILDSDVNQERRFAALLPYGETSDVYDRDQAIDRLINRDLILQQSQLQPEGSVTEAAAAKNLNALRRSIPACKKYRCETQAGWDRFLATEGFNQQSLTKLWRQRMEVMVFIEQRFQMGIRISPQEVQTYYEKTMLPEYAARHVMPPPVQSISSRIQKVLQQQQVSKLLDDWLESLRAQGNVVVLHPGEEAP